MSIGDTMSKFFLPRLAKKILWEQIGVTSDISPYERGVANTSVEFHAGKLMALHEASFPFEFTTSDEGIMKSLGFFDYDGKLVHPMTAHPKIDPETGELILFAYKLEKKPHLIISKVSADGKLHSTIPVFNLDRASMIHDFAITENYIVFCDTSLVFTPKNAGINIFNFGRTKAVFEFDTSRPARVGVLKKDSTNEADIKWFDVNPAFFFHSINAWEEKDPKSGEVLLKYMICKADNNSIDLNDVEKIRTGVYLWEINLNSGKVSEDYMLFKWPDSEELKPLYADFPQISPHKIGRKMDFAYLARVSAEPTASYNGEFYKLDLRKNPPEISRYQLSKGQFATEASFVHQSSESDEKLEGSGFLVSIVSSVNGDGEVHIINADSMELEYRGKLPNRIPFGFHGRYLLEEEYLTANQQ
jgi:carotenoid cleavage dioxygenase